MKSPNRAVPQASAGTPILECRNLSISYSSRSGDVPAVVDFNLNLLAGEAHGLVGESGCGKSTVALAIMRHLGPAGRVVRGQILFQGRDILAMGAEELRRIRGAAIAMIYQEPMASLNPSMTLGEQLIEVPMYHDGASRRDAADRARAMLARVQLADTDRMMRSYPHQISGGQQQRIVIAMALLSNPQLLLLDEPTTALDVTVEAGIVDLIRSISEEFGTSMLYISHNLGLVRETCNRITVMYSGQAVEVGPIQSVFGGMRHPYTRGLFAAIPTIGADKTSRPLVAIPGQLPPPLDRPKGCMFGPRCAWFVADRCDSGPIELAVVSRASGRDGASASTGTSGLNGTSASNGTAALTGTAVHSTRCVRVDEIDWDTPPAASTGRSATTQGDVLLKVNDLTKRYRHVLANDGLTFEVRRGETVAIVGESGCGKSTFARILTGLAEATSGSIRMEGLELTHLPVSRRTRDTIRSLQMVFQNPFDTLNPAHTVGSQIARVIRKFGVERDESRIRQRVLELLDLVKLPREFSERRPRQLSGGQKQRVGLARAFAGNPTMVVADEPLSALDVSVQAAVTNLLLDIQRQRSTTLLFISHDLSLVHYLSDRVVVMYLGQIMEQGRTEEVFAPPYHPYTEALLAAVPVPDQQFAKRKVVLSGEIPSASNPPVGCRFSTRCAYRIPGTCDVVPPVVQEFAPQHRIACHLPRSQLQAMQPVFGIRAPDASTALNGGKTIS
jgi:peptide/nickel transport system ATP-binding protein